MFAMKIIIKGLIFLATIATSSYSLSNTDMNGLVAMSDMEMSRVSGQALMTNDYIGPHELVGAGSDNDSVLGNGSTPYDYSFYRMGMNGRLSLNMNLSKFQLGCGGANDALGSYSECDIDLDYMRLMGVDQQYPGRPAGCDLGGCNSSPGNIEGVQSAFQMLRPYISLAIKNDHSTTLREIVGFKVGGEEALGALSVGRVYENGQFNEENGNGGYTGQRAPYDQGDLDHIPHTPGVCQSGHSYGDGQLACHSGINSISGFLGAELSTALTFGGSVRLWPLPAIPLDAVGCVGRLSDPDAEGCRSGYNNEPLFVDLSGTRMSYLKASGIATDIQGDGITELFNLVGINDIYATLFADLRLLHYAIIDTKDFFISNQRAEVAWPSAAKIPLKDQVPLNPANPRNPATMSDSLWDACGQGAGSPTRCDSAYAVTANTGWWMNAPSVKLKDIIPPSKLELGRLSVPEALSLLGAPGVQVNNANLGLQPAKNCYGSASFC